MEKYTIYASPRSPFARRIRTALKRFAIPYEEVFMDVLQRNENLLAANPLGLVPTLFTPDVGVLTDSATILEYLHEKTGSIWPKEFSERMKMRQVSTWCEGVMQFCVSYFLETTQHEAPSQSWIKEYEDIIFSTLAHLNKMQNSTWMSTDGKLTQAGWDLGVAFQYAQLRLPHLKVDENFPVLLSVLGKCLESKEFQETAPPKM